MQNSDPKSKDWKRFDERSLSTICYEKEVKQLEEQKKQLSKSEIETSPRNSFKEKPSQLTRSSQQFSSANLLIESDLLYKHTKIDDYLKNYPAEFVKNRVIYGYLNKKAKKKVKIYNKRWFFLISAKSLGLDPNYEDEKILQENEVPTNFNLDTLYYFKIKTKDELGQPKGVINMMNCLDVLVKDMSKSKEKGFTFRVNACDRIYQLMSDLETDRRRWVQALKNSTKTAKQLKKKGISVVKNIDVIVKLYDTCPDKEKKAKLQQKIIQDFDKLHESLIPGKLNPQNMKEFINLQDGISNELLNIINACLVEEVKRQDIIKEYIDYVHEFIICKNIKLFWDSQHIVLDSQSILNFASWLNDYSEKMKKYITDDRLYSAIRVLVSIYIERTSVGMRELIQGIIDFERNSPSYETSDQNLLVTSTPIDIFKIINEGLDLGYFVCKLKDMAISLAVQAKNLMSYYINEVFEDDSVLKINQLIAFCNNAIQFTKLIASYNERLNQECGLSEAECERFFDADKLKQSIIQLADTIYREIFTSIFSKIGASFAKKFFLDLNIEDILQDIVTKSHPIIKQLHDRFAKKIWKSFLENFVMLYLQTLILSCNKSKKGDLQLFIEKITSDKEYLEEQFDVMLTKNVLE